MACISNATRLSSAISPSDDASQGERKGRRRKKGSNARFSVMRCEFNEFRAVAFARVILSSSKLLTVLFLGPCGGNPHLHIAVLSHQHKKKFSKKEEK